MSEKTPEVLRIFISKEKGLPMEPREVAYAIPGEGLIGDRYTTGKGAFSNSKRKVVRDITFISAEAIEESNQLALIPFKPEETRRNILTEGVDLNQLVGVEFQVGTAAIRGIELCDPCGRPSKLAGKPGFKEVFEGRGGLRAEIIESGLIKVGSSISVPNI